MSRVLLADDHKMILDSMSRMIGDLEGMEVIGQALDGKEAIRIAQEMKPDIVFMDINMPGMDGIAATKEILSKQPEVKIIALTSHTQPEMIQEMFKAGALGFLGKNCKGQEIEQAIASSTAGQYYISETLTGEVIESFVITNKPKITAFSDNLTQREREVLRLIAEGYSSKEIAAKLSISSKTIGAHRENLMKKLDLHNIAGLTRYAIQRGIVEL